MESLQIHYGAVIAAAALSFVLGALWYSPILFAGAWMRAAGLSEARVRDARLGKVFGLAGLCSLLMAFNLAAFIGARGTLAFGLFAGAATGLGWVAMSLAVIYLFEQRPLRLWLINGGYQVLSYTLMGAVIGAWR